HEREVQALAVGHPGIRLEQRGGPVVERPCGDVVAVAPRAAGVELELRSGVAAGALERDGALHGRRQRIRARAENGERLAAAVVQRRARGPARAVGYALLAH